MTIFGLPDHCSSKRLSHIHGIPCRTNELSHADNVRLSGCAHCRLCSKVRYVIRLVLQGYAVARLDILVAGDDACSVAKLLRHAPYPSLTSLFPQSSSLRGGDLDMRPFLSLFAIRGIVLCQRRGRAAVVVQSWLCSRGCATLFHVYERFGGVSFSGKLYRSLASSLAAMTSSCPSAANIVLCHTCLDASCVES